jgi:hypothetical protein
MEGHLIGLRFGPSYEAVFRYVSLQFAGGVSGALLNNVFTHQTAVSNSSGSGINRSTSTETEGMWGPYGSAKLSVNFVHGISLYVGGSYHSLGTISQTAGAQQAIFDFRNMIYGVAGISYAF